MSMSVQRVLAILGIVVLSPFIALIAIAVRLTSRGPVIHRAIRVRGTGTFVLLKFRTMTTGLNGPAVTSAGDPRVTRIGRLLRRTKLDELPQLWNVVRGDMALVGPRPEDPRYVDLTDRGHRRVFSAPPGITGPTALAFRDEESILAAEALRFAAREDRDSTTDEDVDRAYREVILPAKLAMDEEYLRTRSARRDLALIVETIRQVLRRPRAN